MSRLPLSVFIITLNEEGRIARAIESVREWADEVIVIDSGSTDRTVAIAGSLDAKVMYHAWPGYGPQKRFGEEQCRHDWLLNIDADERISPALREEIAALFAQGPPPLSGYTLPVKDLLPGETGLSPFAHVNRVLRLYDRRRARFADSTVHDTVHVKEGQAGALAHPVLHETFLSVTQAIDKLNRYSSMQAEDMARRGKCVAFLRLAVEFPAGFLKAYVGRLYMLRGRRGFIYAVIYGFSRFARAAKAIEKKLP